MSETILVKGSVGPHLDTKFPIFCHLTEILRIKKEESGPWLWYQNDLNYLENVCHLKPCFFFLMHKIKCFGVWFFLHTKKCININTEQSSK